MILDEVKDKKEFRGLSDDFVSRILVKLSKKYDVLDKKQRKELIKESRARLRELHSAFRTRSYSKKSKYLDEMKIWNDKEICSKILKLHISSRERLPYYDELYGKLRESINFKSVLDLGCGLNVFSLPWLGYVDYYGVDVNREETDFCNKYLNKFSLGGAVRWGDLLGFDKFVKTDVCFMFKVAEALEAMERGATEKLMNKITSPVIVASFATKSLGGKKTISARRLKWFEKICTVKEKFKIGTEVYYVIDNSS